MTIPADIKAISALPDAPLAMPEQDLAPAGWHLPAALQALLSWRAPARTGTGGIRS